MAYALAMESSHNKIFNDPSIGHHSGDVMLIVTILYSLYTILGVSSFLHPIMTRCGVVGGSSDKVEDPTIENKNNIEKELVREIQ